MNSSEISDKFIDYSSALFLVRDELEWILNVVSQKQVKPGTALGDEMIGKFYSLYEDFKSLRGKIMQLMKEALLLEECRYDSPDQKKLYIDRIETLLKDSSMGNFEKFIKVAESGILPTKS